MVGAFRGELDQLSSASDGSDGEQLVSSSPVRARPGATIAFDEEETDPMSVASRSANRRKRSFNSEVSLSEAERDLSGGLSQEILPAGEGFMPAVLERIREGLELSGDPSVRDDSMRLFKGMTKTQEIRDRLMILNQREQELSFGWHGRSRVGQLNAQYYAKTMPTRLGGREKK